ncbi:alternate-type signal peptide domain-containing protein [Microbacterium phosphatis]|uniref:alternate-type signal peptide domain-containing protein n=1 Tax=Microbacterium phosphatis TaxID=3140248 RepID=UPI0031403FFF
MNKLAKGAIATAAGVALLLGGAGTFALWNDGIAVDAAGEPLGTGVLQFTDDSVTGTWYDVSDGGEVRIDDIGSFVMVPGDVLEFRGDVTVESQGTNLHAQITYDPASIVIPDGLQGLVDVEFAEHGQTQPIQIAPSDTRVETTAPFDLRVSFDAEGTVGQGETPVIDLSGLQFVLQQVRPAVGP